MKPHLTWLHISDIHFHLNTEWRDDTALAALLKYLRDIYSSDDSFLPDFIFCTGDIAFGETESLPLAAQYNAAQGFFELLRQISGRGSDPLPCERLFVVPGNHDVNRRAINEDAQARLIELAKDPLSNTSKINDRFHHRSLEFKESMKRLDAYAQFVEHYLPHQHDPDGRHRYASILDIDGLRVGVAGFNSAWSCSGPQDDRNLWLAAAWQFNAAKSKLEAADLRIGLIHHPIDWLNAAEQHIARQRISTGFDFWLHGHNHSAWVEPTQSHVTIAAGAIGAEISEEFGINLVRLDLRERRGVVHLNTYTPAAGGWTIAPVAKHAPNGQWAFTLPTELAERVTLLASRILRDPSNAAERPTAESVVDAITLGFLRAITALTEIGRTPELRLRATKLRSWLEHVDTPLAIKRAVAKALTSSCDRVKNTTATEFAERIDAYLEKARFQLAIPVLIGAAILEKVRSDIGVLPTYLIQQIGLPDVHIAQFESFLYVFRQSLSQEPSFGDTLSYADALAGSDQIKGFTGALSSPYAYIEGLEANLRFECQHRSLSDQERQALDLYLLHLREHQLPYAPLALTSSATQNRAAPRLNDLFVPVDVRDPATQREASAKAHRTHAETPTSTTHSAPADAGAVLQSTRPVVLLGPVGSGKTTVLRHMALAFAEGRSGKLLGWNGSGVIPFFVKLKSFAAFLHEQGARFFEAYPTALVSYLEHYYREGQRVPLTPDFFVRLLDGGGCGVFMDGLDEVPSGQRAQVAAHLAAFITRFGDTNRAEQHARTVTWRNNIFVVTSRPKGYDAVALYLRDASPWVRELKPLEPKGIRQLIDNLLKYLEPDTEHYLTDLKRLCDAIFAKQELTQLAGTPLFCTSLVQVYKYHGAQLPQRRVDVFEEIVNLLLGFWDAQDQKAIRTSGVDEDEELDGTGTDLNTTVERKRRRLSHIALQMQVSEKRTEIDFVTLLDILSKYLADREGIADDQLERHAMKFLTASRDRSGLLVETDPTDPPIYAFSHEGFREFLVADALRNFREAKFISTILDNIDNPTWEEIIVLVGAYRKVPDDLREHLLDECVSAAEDCKATGNGEGWIRRLGMAGRMARDMGDHLSPHRRLALKKLLLNAAKQPSHAIRHRLEIAIILDELALLTDDLYAFSLIDDTTTGRQFYLGKHLVANEQYQRFLDASDFGDALLWMRPLFVDDDSRRGAFDVRAEEWLGRNSDKRVPMSWHDPKFGIAHRGLPLVGVSWYEANAYCRWLQRHWNQLEESRQNPTVRPVGVRLPAPAEWDIAVFGAREEGLSVPWRNSAGDAFKDTDDVCAHANIGGRLDQTSPVGMFENGDRHPRGLADVCGNAWEWQAGYGDYSQRAVALRGGAFTTALGDVDADLKGWRDPSGRDNDIGFRILLEVGD